ncbi:MAG TPA: transaldolase family protein [Thermoleophilia bacterium]|nr:transaldolase family protein [Thermoleophilia bacterium]
MQERNLMEALVDVSPGMEIWWDSSPVIFENFTKKELAKADEGDKDVLTRQFARMYERENPMGQLFRGVTTNPPLSLQAIQDDPARWEKVAQELIEDYQPADREELFWLLYKRVIKAGSDMFLPLFEASGYKQGFLSGQVDPRSVFDYDAMLRQALEIHEINPNVMIKCPGSKQGYQLIEELTSRGIATNNTLTFVLSQLMDCAKTVQRGLEKAKANGVDLSKWRSVITHMEARYGDLGGLRDFAKEEGVELTEGDVRTAELAIFKKAYHTVKERGYPSKMLSCSLRLGPTVDGETRIWHLEEKAGGNIVVTLPPPLIDELLFFPTPEKIVYDGGAIWKDFPEEVMSKLLRVPYFARAYDEDGYARDEYNTHPALVKTAEQFSKATNDMVEFAGKCLEGSCFAAPTPA